MWESGKPSTPDRAISWSVLSDSLWSAPDTLAWAGDNRRPKFYRMSDGGFVSASWETRRGVHWGILSSVGQIFGGVLQWMERGVPVSSNPLADDRQAVMQISPMITSAPADLLMWTAAVWTTAANGNDSIALRVLTSPGPVYRSGRPGTIDQNPDISTGVFHSGSIRLWTAWESDSSGHWALFGSSVDVPLNLVGGDPAPPGRARLLQNYPNPFNPVTTIRFTIPPGAAHTSLKVFDLLGREVATVVDEELSPGGHSVGFDGSGLASGVYIYRLRWGAGTETRRMVVLR